MKTLEQTTDEIARKLRESLSNEFLSQEVTPDVIERIKADIKNNLEQVLFPEAKPNVDYDENKREFMVTWTYPIIYKP